ncbi:MAG TPA: hypothetical protein VM328_04850 [Fimbriimonadaceae bacterium]|nr:hypothetical protein [Fimbriimonadaceae bacterium]
MRRGSRVGRRLYGLSLVLVSAAVLVLCWPLFDTLPDLVQGAIRTRRGEIPGNYIALALIAVALAITALASLLVGIGVLLRSGRAAPDRLPEAEQ